MFIELLIDALVDSLKTIPFLLFIYILIEIIENRWGNKLGIVIGRAGAAGPAIGALAGSVPQCGISVMGTALYTQRMVTIGTLMAVYLSTSDEAIPVILSYPDKAGVLVPLLLTKIVLALIVGYSLDFIFRKRKKDTLAHIEAIKNNVDEDDHDHSLVLEEPACCGHTPGAAEKSFNLKAIILHPIMHTLKVFFFLFIVTLALNSIIALVGEQQLSEALASVTILQPIFAAMIGLIPNCAASVAITELYLEGAITFGAVISGLCASGGLGILVLFKESSKKREALWIIGLLFGISVVAGLVIGLFT